MTSGTPSVQFGIPIGDLIFSPHFCSHHTTGRKVIRRRRENYLAPWKLSGGVKTMQRRKNYPRRARVGQKFEKFFRRKSHSAENCGTVPKNLIPYLNTLRDLSISLYITKNTILIYCRNYLNTLPKLCPILTPWRNYTVSIAETIPYPLPKHTLS